MDLSQLLLYGLLVGGFLLFNFLLQRAAQRARRQREQEEVVQPEDAPLPEIEPIEAGWGRSPTIDRRAVAAPVESASRNEPSTAPLPPSVHRPGPKPMFGSVRDLRRAVVFMTVLGPCRALEPHDRPQG